MNTNSNSDIWDITFDGVYNKREASLSTLLATGNGRIGIRGSIPEFGDSQGIYIAGFYDQLPRPELNPDKFNPFLVSWSHLELVRGYKREVCIVKCPDFLAGEWELDGETLNFNDAGIIEFKRNLCLKTGEFTAETHALTPGGKEIRLIQRRFAHMEKTNLVYSCYSIKAINFSGTVKYLAKINTSTENFNISGIYQDTTDGTDYEYIRLYDVVKKERLSDGIISTLVRGRVDGMKAAFATAISNLSEFKRQYVHQDRNDCFIVTEFEINRGETINVERVSTFETSAFVSEPYEAAKKYAFLASENSYMDELNSSSKAWNILWKDSDMVINGDDKVQLGIRHSLYNLLIAACKDSSNVSIPAKGLIGEGYRGMVFWDTDIHMLPFYIYTQPQLARNIVEFRSNTIEGARAKARRHGGEGASYPWETGISGNEECEDFLKLLTHQLHITVDIVFSIQQYIEATGDYDFYFNYASEVYIETARFWINKGVIKDGRMSIPNASGPDELHIEASDSAYVNNLAAYNLSLADDCINTIMREKPELWEKLRHKTGISEDEISKINKYKTDIRTMKTEDGIFEQCEGFFTLKDKIVFEDSLYDIPAETQTVKQADVIMLLYLLPDIVTKEELLKNWNYYEPRTTHTSSLSYGVHGIIAAELGLLKKAEYYLNKSLGIDLYNENTDIGDGAHLAANGMSWAAIVSGIGGCRQKDNRLIIKPLLPDNWNGLLFKLKLRDCRIRVKVTKEKVCVSSSKASKSNLTITIMGKNNSLKPGGRLSRKYR